MNAIISKSDKRQKAVAQGADEPLPGVVFFRAVMMYADTRTTTAIALRDAPADQDNLFQKSYDSGFAAVVERIAMKIGLSNATLDIGVEMIFRVPCVARDIKQTNER